MSNGDKIMATIRQFLGNGNLKECCRTFPANSWQIPGKFLSTSRRQNGTNLAKCRQWQCPGIFPVSRWQGDGKRKVNTGNPPAPRWKKRDFGDVSEVEVRLLPEGKFPLDSLRKGSAPVAPLVQKLPFKCLHSVVLRRYFRENLWGSCQ